MQSLTLQTAGFEKLESALRGGEVVLWGEDGIEGTDRGPRDYSLSFDPDAPDGKCFGVEIEEWSGWEDYHDSRDEPGYTGWTTLDHSWCQARLLCDAIGWLQAHEYTLPPEYSFTQEYRVVERDVVAFGPVFVPTWGGLSLSQVASRIVEIGLASDEDDAFSHAVGAPVECYALMRRGTQKQVLGFLTSVGLTPERYQAVIKSRVDAKWLYNSGVGMDRFFDPCGCCDGGYARPGQAYCPNCVGGR